jgi:hypothetical protein
LTAGAQIRGFHQTMPARAERLADHFIKATGIAAVYVDGAGAIGTFANVGLGGIGRRPRMGRVSRLGLQE